jgi:uncharacterized protein YlaI
MAEPCTNCAAPDAKQYDLLLRNDEPTTTYLCDECREALRDAVETA